MKKITYKSVLLSCAISLLSACSETEYGQYSVEGVAPGPVTQATYEALPGAVKVRYKLPIDEDLSYVKAVYQLDNGTYKEAKTSAYTNVLLLDGFGKGDSIRTVKLVAVDINRNESEPLLLDVKPLESPVYKTLETVNAEAIFGGVRIKWKNPEDFNVILVLNRQSIAGKYEQPYGGMIFASGTGKDDVRAVQGIDTLETNFTIHVEDRWGNKSEKYSFRAKPIFEQEIDKSQFKRWNPTTATGDDKITYQAWWGFDIEKMWDGIHGGNSTADNCYSTVSGNKINKLTFDMQGVYTLSRMKLWARRNYKYTAIPEYMRVWGSNAPAGIMPTFDQEAEPADYRWNLLTEEQGPDGGYHLYKPSGSAGNTSNAADIEYAEKQGVDISFNTYVPSRYVCFEMIQMWGEKPLVSNVSACGYTIGEIGMWGQKAN